MTRPAASIMADPDEKRSWRWLRIGALGFGAVFLAGVAAGFAKATLEEGGGIGLAGGAFIAGVGLLALGFVWLLIRALNRPTGEAQLSRRELLNRNILFACGALGFATALLMMFTRGEADITHNLLSNQPLQPAIAIALLVLLGVVLPILSFIWHRRAVDEQEVAAYKTGALWGINIFMIGAPLWWIAWRGGFLPAPDFIVIYFATITVMGAVWMWKKYG